MDIEARHGAGTPGAMKPTLVLCLASIATSACLAEDPVVIDESTATAESSLDVTAVRCQPSVRFRNLSADGNGRVFDDLVPDPIGFSRAAAQRVCDVLYRAQSDVPAIRRITLVVEDMDGVAYAWGSEVHLSSTYLADYAASHDDEETAYEIAGIIHHEYTHIYQYFDGPGWLIEGVADFVRLRAGFIPMSNRRPGGAYDDAYQTTAFFLAWIDDRHPGFGHQLNQSLTDRDDRGWSTDVFEELTGTDVDTLWSEYQASLP